MQFVLLLPHLYFQFSIQQIMVNQQIELDHRESMPSMAGRFRWPPYDNAGTDHQRPLSQFTLSVRQRVFVAPTDLLGAGKGLGNRLE